jgi:hypothetical protein
LLILPDALRLVLRVSEELFLRKKLKLDLRGAPGWSPLPCATLAIDEGSGEPSLTEGFEKLGGRVGVVLAMMGVRLQGQVSLPNSRANVSRW